MTILAARLLVAGMFALAALAKLADRDGARQAVRAFGVPQAFSAVVAAAIVATEFATAALLLARPWTGAIAAA